MSNIGADNISGTELFTLYEGKLVELIEQRECFIVDELTDFEESRRDSVTAGTRFHESTTENIWTTWKTDRNDAIIEEFPICLCICCFLEYEAIDFASELGRKLIQGRIRHS